MVTVTEMVSHAQVFDAANAEGARIKAPRGGVLVEGVSHSPPD